MDGSGFLGHEVHQHPLPQICLDQEAMTVMMVMTVLRRNFPMFSCFFSCVQALRPRRVYLVVHLQAMP